MIESKNIYVEAFENYKKLGLDPLPIPYEDGHPTKGSKITGWPTKAASGQYTAADFSGPCNIGVLLGGTRNLTDIDCDSPEAVLIGSEVMADLMQTTGRTMMFGRQSKPHSHYIWCCDASLPTAQVRDPSDGEMIIEYRCVKEDGERGQQTVLPPSLRYDIKTGDVEEVRLEEDSATEPISVSAAGLQKRFRLIAATGLLAKHFPVESERHNTILALAGVLARAGMEEQKATDDRQPGLPLFWRLQPRRKQSRSRCEGGLQGPRQRSQPIFMAIQN